MNKKKTVSVVRALIALACFLPAGCMTSRGISSVNAPGDVSRPVTARRYRIAQVQERMPNGQKANVHSNRRMREMLDGADDLGELTSFVPGVFADDGIPVVVTFYNWRSVFKPDWTMLPCFLTLGICPYFQHEEFFGDVEVSLDADPSAKVSFSYVEKEDWKISFLFELGSVPYEERVVGRNEFQACGHGDVLSKAHLEGLAHGIAASLAELERRGVK